MPIYFVVLEGLGALRVAIDARNVEVHALSRRLAGDDAGEVAGEVVAFGIGRTRRCRRDRSDNIVTGIAIGGDTIACARLSIRHC